MTLSYSLLHGIILRLLEVKGQGDAEHRRHEGDGGGRHHGELDRGCAVPVVDQRSYGSPTIWLAFTFH